MVDDRRAVLTAFNKKITQESTYTTGMSGIRAPVIYELVELFPAHIKGVLIIQVANTGFLVFSQCQDDIPMITETDVDFSFLSDAQLGSNVCRDRNLPMLVGS